MRAAFGKGRAGRDAAASAMPTLTRLLAVLALLAGLVFAAMAALVAFVRPTPVPISFEVPVPALAEPAAPPAAPAPGADAVPVRPGVYDEAGSVIVGPPEGPRP